MMAKAKKCTASEIEFSLHVAGIKVLLEKDDHLRNNTTTTRVWTVEILTKRLPPSPPFTAPETFQMLQSYAGFAVLKRYLFHRCIVNGRD